MILTLIACGRSKASHPLPARELYTGSFFRSARATAIATSPEWRIVSAKHGIVTPERVLAPYSVFVGDLSASELGALREFVRAEVERLRRSFEVRSLLPRRYHDLIADLVPMSPIYGMRLGIACGELRHLREARCLR